MSDEAKHPRGEKWDNFKPHFNNAAEQSRKLAEALEQVEIDPDDVEEPPLKFVQNIEPSSLPEEQRNS